MNNALELLSEEIKYNTYEIHDLSKVIRTLDDLIANEPDNENHKILMKETIDRYKVLVRKTKIQLEAYIAEEVKANQPADMVFRKLYKKIKNAL